MKKQINDIREFQKKLAEVEEGNVPKGHNGSTYSTESLDRIRLRHDLAIEELEETQKAVIQNNQVEVLDGLVDQLYILLGSVHEYGMLDKFEQAWDLVHANNMTKLGEDGKVHKNENGKVIKPSNYKPVDLSILFNDA